MSPIEAPPEIECAGKVIQVSGHSVAGERVFYLEFPDQRKPLKILVAEIIFKGLFLLSLTNTFSHDLYC